MIIRAHRVQLIWSPLVGWVLLTCTTPQAAAQIVVTPPGGVTAPVAAPDNVTPASPAGPTGATGFPTVAPSELSITPPPAAPAVPLPVLPAGTTVQNPSTQLVPGTSDIVGGYGTLVGGGGAAPGGEETGYTLGSFRLYPQLEVTVGYDTNVFAQSASQGIVASPYTSIQPSLSLRSDWLNNSLGLLLSGGFGFYSAAPTQNYQNYIALADGRFDIREDTYVTWSGGFKRTTEALGSPNVAFAQAPTVDDTFPFTATLYHRFNRLTVEAGGTITRYLFTDYSTITSQGLSGPERDRFEYEERIRFGYDLSDDVTFYLAPSLKQIRYDEYVDSSGQIRNADGATINVGAMWKLSPTSILDGSVGYTSQTTQGGGGTTGDFTFGLRGSWNGYEPLTIRPTITRDINQSALSNYKNTVSTTFGFDFAYVLHSDWTAIGGASYTTEQYQPVEGLAGVPPRTDTFVRGSLGLLYTIRPQVQIGPVFEYTQGSSTDPVNGPSYSRELFSIRLIARP